MTNAEARFNKSLRPRKPEGSLGRTAQDVHLDSHTAPELCLTACSVWHEGLPDHFRPCQNTWAPHYAAARDWLKSKGVSALTDRSGVV